MAMRHGLVKTLQDNIYYYQDELGSTSHIASSSGALLEYYKYNLYGLPTYWNASGSQVTASAYNVKDLGDGGARWIVELSLYDDRNRFMSPALGRFIRALEAELTNYVGGNPDVAQRLTIDRVIKIRVQLDMFDAKLKTGNCASNLTKDTLPMSSPFEASCSL